MKTRTKALLLVMSALLLIVSTVFATMAYLTSKTGVITNTFSVGNVSITMDETLVNEYGKYCKLSGTDLVEVATKAEAGRAQANSYKLIPGHTYTKDPTIHVADKSEPCYLFIKVVNDIIDIEAAGKTVNDQILAKGWTVISTSGNVTIYGKATAIDARGGAVDVATFETINIATNADLTGYAGKTVTIQACAIQADGFADMNAAWTTGFGSNFPTP